MPEPPRQSVSCIYSTGGLPVSETSIGGADLTFRTPAFGRRLGTGRTRLVLPVLVVLAVLLVVFMIFTTTYTNLLWYRSIGFSSVYTTQLQAKIALFFGAGLLMTLVVGANILIASRLRPAYRLLPAAVRRRVRRLSTSRS